MLESTFMATHSSFFAMIGVAEQLGNLRNWLGEILNVFTLLRWVKRMLGMGGNDAQAVTGGAADGALSAEGFRAFESNGGVVPQNQKASTPKPSKKPLIIFFLTVVGLPWLMNKLVRLITARQEAEARRLGLPEGAIVPIFGQDGQPLPQHMQPPGVDLSLLPSNQPQALQDPPLDPSKLTFVRAVHSYQPPTDDGFELSFEKNDIIAVLTPKEERQDPGWWRGRLRNGKIGWFPSTHVQEVPMKDGSNSAKASDTK
jgi:peroxin-13